MRVRYDSNESTREKTKNKVPLEMYSFIGVGCDQTFEALLRTVFV